MIKTFLIGCVIAVLGMGGFIAGSVKENNLTMSIFFTVALIGVVTALFSALVLWVRDLNGTSWQFN